MPLHARMSSVERGSRPRAQIEQDIQPAAGQRQLKRADEATYRLKTNLLASPDSISDLDKAY